MIDYLFEIVGEDSPYCGEEFFVEVDNLYENDPCSIAWEIALEPGIFREPNVVSYRRDADLSRNAGQNP